MEAHGASHAPVRTRYIQLINPAKAHWFVVPNSNVLAIQEWK